MSGIFLFVLIMTMVLVAMVVKPQSNAGAVGRLAFLAQQREFHLERLRSMESGKQVRASDVEDEEQALFLIDTEMSRLRSMQD